MRVFLILVVPSMLFLCSCKKKVNGNACENKIDSILTYMDEYADEPSPYIAAYPESWWIYSTGEKISCTSRYYPIYDLENEDLETCQNTYSVYRFNGPHLTISRNPYLHYGMISGGHNISIRYKAKEFNKALNYIEDSFINNLMSDSWVVTSRRVPGLSDTTTRQLNQLHTNFTLPTGEVFTNVAEIQENFEAFNHKEMTTSRDSTLFYYSKEIGLIMVDFFDPSVTDIYLTDYFIGPH